ncbi:nicotinamidase-like [Clavelina lepadiformis]|uniref:nicotinamidase-like n=1 Tax=Clavelina lepadiformis TaxID=159417 RepID=UPI0040411CD6
MPKSALVVVDVQNDFISGTLALKDCPAKEDGLEVVDVINELTKLEGWDLVVFTLDWHPQDHISFATNAHKFKQHCDSKVHLECAEVYDKVVFNVEDDQKREQVLWPPHCVQGSWGAELHEDVYVPAGSVTVKKGVNTSLDSYSAFFDNDKINETELCQVLQSHGIDRTFICGLATDICVNFTATHSNELGFKTYVIEDACRGVDNHNIQCALCKMDESGITRIKSDKISSLLTTKEPPMQ